MNTYAGERRIADADSHIMEPDRHWLERHADASVVDRLRAIPDQVGLLSRRKSVQVDEIQKLPEDERARKLLHDKGWLAMGASNAGDRSAALDLLGFTDQLVFPTFSLFQFHSVSDLTLLYGGAKALGRAVTDFCSADERLLPVCYLPLADPEESLALLNELLELGCAAVWVPAAVQGTKSPTHPQYDPIWRKLQEKEIPFLLHIGGDGGALVDKAYHNNGIEVRPLNGGGESVRSKDYFGIAHSTQLFLASMILDGVFDRFPKLMGGVIELGALWVPGWLRALDLVQQNFVRMEPHLAELRLKPSDYVKRHLRFTPFSHEPVGWLIEQTDPHLYMFSSDFPHPEGGRDPLKKFEASGIEPNHAELFYYRNFDSLMSGRTD